MANISPDDSVEDFLVALAEQLKQDANATHLAELAEKALATCRLGGSRETELGVLTEFRDKLHQARQLGSYQKETGMLENVVGRWRMDTSFGLKSDMGAQAKDQDTPEFKEMMKQIQEADAASRPYEFVNNCEATEMTVNIRVPPETQKQDVSVKVTSKTIRVEVAGHELQPVIEGSFFRPVEEVAFDYHLEGSGDKRRLVLDLEKEEGGVKWPDLLNLGLVM
mmetsp:Transcript_12174/g.32325  ORF Transcript_12174/g.32325 Transcript_12174/m.32325 type:complete len:223 (+) Transcript_12174:62-730(+)